MRGGEALALTDNGGFSAFEDASGETVYFTKYDAPGIYRMPASGGDETFVIPNLRAMDWGASAVVERGLFFVARNPTRVLFHDFETTEILQTPVRVPSDTPTLGAAIDAQTIFLMQLDREESDIKIMEL